MSELSNKIDLVRDILRTDDGISGAMDYTLAISWVLFLKFLDDHETQNSKEAFLENREYKFIIDEKYRWKTWACPKDSAGKLDIRNAITSEDLTDFVNQTLFPYLKSFNNDIQNVKSVRYMVGNIFGFITNNVVNGSTLRDVLNIVDTLNFQNSDEMFELSQVYEKLLKNMGGSSDAGEFYTPRAVIKAMVESVSPKVGQTIYDAAVGSGGFLIQAYEFMKNEDLSTNDQKFLKQDTFYGNEKTPLGYVMGVMNMILHGIDSPNVFKQNTLTSNIRDIQEKDRHDIILANPPFGGKEKSQVQQNFPVQSGATEILFMQHFMKMLKLEGKAAIVVPEGVLFQGNNAFKQVKKELLENFNVHTILSLPTGVFLPYSPVKTSIIYFDRKGSTSDIWYYELLPPHKLTKNKPIQYTHFKEFLHLKEKRKKTKNSWLVELENIKDYDISAKNPNIEEKEELLPPKKILSAVKKNNQELELLYADIENLLNNNALVESVNWKYVTLDQALDQGSSNISLNKIKDDEGDYPIFSAKGFYKNISFYHQEKDYIAIIKDGAGIGRLSVHPAKSSIVGTMQYLIPKDGFDLMFVKYFLTGIDFHSYKQGATIPHIYFKDYKAELIPKLPIAEQKRIVDKIARLFAKIDKAISITSGLISLNKQSNLEGQSKHLYQLKSSILSELFSGRI